MGVGWVGVGGWCECRTLVLAGSGPHEPANLRWLLGLPAEFIVGLMTMVIINSSLMTRLTMTAVGFALHLFQSETRAGCWFEMIGARGMCFLQLHVHLSADSGSSQAMLAYLWRCFLSCLTNTSSYLRKPPWLPVWPLHHPVHPVHC